MTLNSDAKFWFQKWHEELVKNYTLVNPEKLYIDGLFLSKAYIVSTRIFQMNYVSCYWRVMQNLKGNWLMTWRLTRNLVNFYASSRKSRNWHFDELLLSKAYKDLDEKVKKSYVTWHWRVMQSLKKNWLLVPKMTWRIWCILMRPVASLKVCTLM